MQKEQCTIGSPIKAICKEPYGANPIQVTMSPADPNTGIIFTNGKEQVKLDNKYIIPSWRWSLIKTILLKSPDSPLKIRSLEHFLGTFKAVYGIDNATVHLSLDPTFTHKLFSIFKTKLSNNIPLLYFPDLQRGLCSRIEEVGVVPQGVKKPVLRLEETIDTGKLKLEPTDKEDVQIRVTTSYRVASGGKVEDDVTVSLVPEQYKYIAHARAYFGVPLAKFTPAGLTRKTGFIHSFPTLASKGIMRFAGNFLHLGYGYGHGVDEKTTFYPPATKAQWRNDKELMKGEVAYHGVIDKAGDLVARLNLAFGATPIGMKLTCKFAGHADSHKFVRACETKYASRFYIE